MKILVTGANGMLGQDLCPMLETIKRKELKVLKY